MWAQMDASRRIYWENLLAIEGRVAADYQGSEGEEIEEVFYAEDMYGLSDDDNDDEDPWLSKKK